MSSDTSDKPSADKKPCPANIKPSSTAKAIKTSRTMTRARLAWGTAFRALANRGMLPSGSVISSSKMVAEAKLCSTRFSFGTPCQARQSP